jgi:hypothetical protein
MKQRAVCISPLDWGLGHATRCIPIALSFQELGYKVYIATDGYQEAILKEALPNAHFLKLKGYGIRYTKLKSLLFFSLLWQVPKMIARITSEYFWLKKIQQQYNFDLIVSDNRFGFFHKNVNSVFITHQLNLQTPFTWTSSLYQIILSKWLQNFKACWIPDTEEASNLSGVLIRPKHKPRIAIWYMGYLSRLHNKETISNESNENEIEFLGIVSGPEPQRTLFENQIWNAGNEAGISFVMIAGLPNQKLYNKITPSGALYHHLAGKELTAQIQRAKYIICRGGYTSLMELFPFHKKLILVPTPGQTEQMYLAKYWSDQKWAISFDQSTFDLTKALQQAASTDYAWPHCNEFSTSALAATLNALPL